MPTFASSPGHQFVRSPGRQRMAGQPGEPYELGESLFFFKWSSAAVQGLLTTPFSVIPAHPPLTPLQSFIDPDSGLLVTTGGTSDYFYEESLSGSDPLHPNYFYATKPSNGASVSSGLPYNSVLNGYLADGLSDEGRYVNDPALELLRPGHEPNIFAVNAAQYQNRICHLSYFMRTPRIGAPFAYLGRKSRFRTLFTAAGWRGLVYVDPQTYTIIPPVAVHSRLTIGPNTWHEVQTPFDVVGDPTNRLSFILHSETPEAWSTRTGIPIIS